MEDIRITFSEENHWTVYQGDQWADRLGYDEMLGLIAALTMPEPRPTLQWMQTKEQHEWRENYFKELSDINNLNQITDGTQTKSEHAGDQDGDGQDVEQI